MEEVLTRHGRIDVLFDNAGVLFAGTTWQTGTEVWDQTMAVNVRGTWLMSRAVVPHMLERGSGAIIINSSVLGLKACPGAAAHTTSKGAITQLTRSLALEFAGTGVRVDAICPGTIVTPMVAEVFALAARRRSRGRACCPGRRGPHDGLHALRRRGVGRPLTVRRRPMGPR